MTQSPVPYCYVYYTGRRFLHCNNLSCVGSDVGFTSSLQNQWPRARVRLQILRNTVPKMITVSEWDRHQSWLSVIHTSYWLVINVMVPTWDFIIHWNNSRKVRCGRVLTTAFLPIPYGDSIYLPFLVRLWTRALYLVLKIRMFNLLFMCICGGYGKHVYMYHVQACLARGQHRDSSSTALSTLFLETWYLTKRATEQLAKLTGEKALGFLLCWPPVFSLSALSLQVCATI